MVMGDYGAHRVTQLEQQVAALGEKLVTAIEQCTAFQREIKCLTARAEQAERTLE
jgi:cell division protein FtsB